MVSSPRISGGLNPAPRSPDRRGPRAWDDAGLPLSARARRQRFGQALQTAMGPGDAPVRVTWHRNQLRMVQIRQRDGVWHFRLHRSFLLADEALIGQLVHYAQTHDAQAAQALHRFVESQQRPALEPARARGTYFDLHAVFDALNLRFFSGAIIATIGWLEGEDWPGLERSCDDEAEPGLAMAAYCVETRQIWVHRSLDAADIPRVYLDWVVFHEMLHQVHDMPIVHGRRIHHSAAFEQAEAAFPGRPQALAWERTHRERLVQALEQPIQRLGQ